jgi:simple sugar transport system ATP-binding protein
MGRDVRFVVAHQPTRGVDLGAIHQIHQRLVELRDRGVGVLLISSELDELMALSDRIIVLESGKVTAQFDRWSESSRQFDRAQIGRAMIGAT